LSAAPPPALLACYMRDGGQRGACAACMRFMHCADRDIDFMFFFLFKLGFL
jgi:hypothetical protein